MCKKLKSKKIDAMKRLKLSCLLLVDVLLLPTSVDGKRRIYNVTYTLPAESVEGDDLSWPGEEEDDKVLHMIGLLQKNHMFRKDSWSGGIDATTPAAEEEDSANAKKGKNKCKASDLIEKLKDFEAKFTDKLKVLSEEVDLIKSQKSVVNAETELISNQSKPKAHMAKDILEASLNKVTGDSPKSQKHPQMGNDSPGPGLDNVTVDPSEFGENELLTKDIIGVVNEVLATKGAPNDAPTTNQGGAQPLPTKNAQPKDKFKVLFAPPSFSLGLTTVKVGYDFSVSRPCFTQLWEQAKRLSDNLMEKLLLFVRDRFFEEFTGSTSKPIEFVDHVFVVDVSKMHPYLKKKSYKIPNKVSKYVKQDRQWLTEVECLYCPYIIDDHWVGLCIDLSSHEIIVLQPDPTKYSLAELQNALLPLDVSLAFLITRCPTNSEMRADSTSPFNIFNYAGEWEIKSEGSHEIATMLLLELHASGILTFFSNLDETSVKNAGKNYGVKLFEKFNSPLTCSLAYLGFFALHY
ncbi:unnamed protein product [Arabis nemorensis]|uniref:Ubiquitin-like protease family profile domain-containing protein n=1 Tax=Arabis nemorensis TaxID=586526 RepID=A0A565ARJ8_9BRAS|nr:unnamed protein product [Arabis nemorensis]